LHIQKPSERFDELLHSFSSGVRELFLTCEKELESCSFQLGAARNGAVPAVLALAELMEGRDSVMFKHSRNVAKLCVQLTTHLGWAPDRVNLMNMVALLHDIGKVIIPDSILLKEGKFTPWEFETMKLHSGTGSRLIKRLGFFGEDAELWVLHHHERWDGDGYPDGISKFEIPVGARIIAIADAFDAITGERRYRQKLPEWMALDEIVQCGGKQFDPDLVSAFQDSFRVSGFPSRGNS